MFWLFRTLLSWASGGVLDRVLTWLERKQDNETTRQGFKRDVMIAGIKSEIAARENAREIRLATAGFVEMRVATVLIVFPFIVHLWLVALDTCFGFGWRISAFPKPFDEWQGLILCSFFGVSGVVSGARIWAASQWGKR